MNFCFSQRLFDKIFCYFQNFKEYILGDFGYSVIVESEILRKQTGMHGELHKAHGGDKKFQKILQIPSDESHQHKDADTRFTGEFSTKFPRNFEKFSLSLIRHYLGIFTRQKNFYFIGNFGEISTFCCHDD